MASSTTHRDAFVSWNAKPATPALDYHVRQTPPPFEGMSTYKVSFSLYNVLVTYKVSFSL